MRKSSVFLILFLILTLALGSLVVVHPVTARGRHEQAQALRRQLVADLELTDLCLFTEARYTRHPSQADLHSAFQDHPLAFEHFPSGALLLPPPHLSRGSGP